MLDNIGLMEKRYTLAHTYGWRGIERYVFSRRHDLDLCRQSARSWAAKGAEVSETKSAREREWAEAIACQCQLINT